MAGPGGPQLPGPAFRVKTGDWLTYGYDAMLTTNNTAVILRSRARVLNDDGTESNYTFADTTVNGVASGTNSGNVNADRQISKEGWLVEWSWDSPSYYPLNSIWITARIAADVLGNVSYETVYSGPKPVTGNTVLGTFTPDTPEHWPLWVFQGQVVSDNGVGTHQAKLTVTFGGTTAGALEVLYGQVIAAGNAGLVESGIITDGTNTLVQFFAGTAAATYAYPTSSANNGATADAANRFHVRSAMKVILESDTSQVSQTQVFSIVCRISHKAIPVATLSDNVGTPTLTTNTNKVF